jgi:hypothetical protein
MLTREVDSIIAEENIDDSVSAVPEEETPNEIPPENPEAPEQPTETPNDEENPEGGDEKDKPEGEETSEAPADIPKDDKPEEKPLERSPTETVTEAKTLIENLNLTQDKVFNDDGSVKKWEDVVPAGAYLASQLDPIKVTDKDGKEHEFFLISDVEKAFPEGFEAKNNLEQMKFERNIMANETKFDEAIKTYKDAGTKYAEETNQIVESRTLQNQVANEYKAMADQGLVPKVGDPNDPKFNESAAVKELNTILAWMDKTNTENATKGLGKIESLYVAKQLMTAQGVKDDKADKGKQIDKERKEVASLSSSPTPDRGNSKPQYQHVPMSRLADQIIASEGLR